MEKQDYLFEALTGLHARACRVAVEIHHLLAGGFPMGALARCRTLHEIAVTMMILADFGCMDEHPDLAERFLLHEDIKPGRTRKLTKSTVTPSVMSR